MPYGIPYIFQRKSPALESVDEADGSDFLEDFHHLMLMIFNFSDLALLDKAEVHFMKKKSIQTARCVQQLEIIYFSMWRINT